MPRMCHSCGYTTPDVWADQCPRCKRPMALTSNTPDAPGARPRRSSRRFWLVASLLLLLALPAVGLGVVYFAPTVFLGPSKDADSTGEIRVGMRPPEVAKALSIEAPQLRGGFVGSITWAKDGRVLRIRFTQGRVAGVEEGSLPVPVSLTRVSEDPRPVRGAQ